MGATTFVQGKSGKSADDAFWDAAEDARYEYGHRGYTGTIAEKSSYVMIELPEGRSVEEFINELIEEGDPRIDDKWGPAGCIDLGPTKEGKDGWHHYVFFGWASC